MSRASGAAPVVVEADAWTALRAFTPARIALGRTGASQASNSGARRSPSTRETYSASWNEVLW